VVRTIAAPRTISGWRIKNLSTAPGQIHLFRQRPIGRIEIWTYAASESPVSRAPSPPIDVQPTWTQQLQIRPLHLRSVKRRGGQDITFDEYIINNYVDARYGAVQHEGRWMQFG